MSLASSPASLVAALIPAPVVERLGWVLVHSVWQFALLAAAALLTLSVTRRSSSELRYRFLLTFMLLVVAAPAGTWLALPIDTVATEVATGSVAPTTPALNSNTTSIAAAFPAIEIANDSQPPWQGAASSVVAVTSEAESRPSWPATVVWVWSLGVLLFSIRPMLGWRTVRWLTRVGTSPVDNRLRAVFAQVVDRLPLRRDVQLLQSTLVKVPLIVGWFRPVILLPVSLVADMPTSQLEAILAHELAHVRRHDYVVNLLQVAVETLFFYHPAVWWLSRQVRLERENCCDDAAVRVTGDRIEYGRALLALEDLRGVQTTLALGVHNGSLLARVRRILSVEEPRQPRSASGFALIGAVAAMILLAGLWAGSNLASEDEPFEEADEVSTAVESDADDEPSVTSPEVATDQDWSRFAPGTDVADHVAAEEIRVTVVGMAGESIAGFELITNRGLVLGKSDETGDIRFDWPAGTQRALLGYHPEFLPWFGAPHAGEVLTIQLEPKKRPEPIPGTKRLSVRIIDSRTAEPVPDVTITADEWEGPYDQDVATAVTNEDGVAELNGLDFLRHRLRLSAKQPVPYIRQHRYSGADNENVVILVDRACQLTLRAVDAQTGVGIPGVQFDRERAAGELWAQLIVPDNLGGNPAAYEKVTTDQDGYFRCLVGPYPWSYMLHGRPPGYKGIVPIDGRHEVEIKTPVGGNVEYTFHLVPEGVTVSANGEIVGQLVSEDGEPVAGATVACGAVFHESGEGGGANAVTDDDGNYRLLVPSPGIYTVWLKKYDVDPEMTAAADDGLQVEAGKVTQSRLLLVHGRKVIGRAVDTDGKPFVNLTVMCYSAARPLSLGGVQSTPTNDEGGFEFYLPPGRARVYAIERVPQTDDNPFGSGRSAYVSLNVPADGITEPLTLTLDKVVSKFGSDEWLARSTPGTQILEHADGPDVTGTVVDKLGQPLAGAQVFKHDGPVVRTDERGAFRVTVERGTQFVMHAFHPGFRVWFGAPTSGDVLKIVLEPKAEEDAGQPEARRQPAAEQPSAPRTTDAARRWREAWWDFYMAQSDDDRAFIRRAYIDLTGIVPKEEDVKRFVSDSDPEKRATLLDRLLKSEDFATFQKSLQSERGFLPSRILRGPAALQRAAVCDVAWGEVSDSLQVGISLRGAAPRIRNGERLPLEIYFRNAGSETVTRDFSFDFIANVPTLVDESGTAIAIEAVLLRGSVPLYKETLRPGDVFVYPHLGLGIGKNPTPGENWNPHTPELEAGKYRLSQTIAEGATGTLEFEVVAKAGSVVETRSDDAAKFTEPELAAIEALKQRGLTLNAGVAALKLRGMEEVTTRTLNAGGVLLTDNDLALLEQMPLLKSVVLFKPVTDDGRVSGPSPLTDDGLKHLRGLVSIERIELSYTKITDAGVSHLQSLSTLRQLGLQSTAVTDACLEVLGNLPRLEELNLSGTAISDAGLDKLTPLTNLASLEIDKTRVTDDGLATVARLENLRRLRIGGPDISDAGVATIAELDHVKELLLHGAAVTDVGMAEIAKMRQLTALVLQGGNYTDEGLKQLQSLRNLESLSLSSLKITDTGLQHLATLQSLRSVYVIAPETTEAGVERLRQALPEARIRAFGTRNNGVEE